MTVPEPVRIAIDQTITALRNRKFDPDPIAGPHFSRIVSVMSSAYKRHGFILELAILTSVMERPEFEAWEDRQFQVTQEADALANKYLSQPDDSLEAQLPYSQHGTRSLQVDLVAYHPESRHLGVYEIKRGSGLHDAGKRRQILRDLICMQVLAKSYGKFRGLEVQSASAHAIFYYGKCSVGPPFALTGDDLDAHFGYPLRDEVEAANELFKRRLFEILSA